MVGKSKIQEIHNPGMPFHKGYFEGIFQLRFDNKGDGKNKGKEVASYIRECIANRADVYITKEVRLSTGLDFYVTSQRYLRSLGSMVSKRFAGELKMSSTVHTRDHLASKELYRVNVLFRCLPFGVGEVIEYRGDEVKITQIGAHIKGKILSTGKSVILKL